jgi:hypothetical protein
MEEWIAQNQAQADSPDGSVLVINAPGTSKAAPRRALHPNAGSVADPSATQA